MNKARVLFFLCHTTLAAIAASSCVAVAAQPGAPPPPQENQYGLSLVTTGDGQDADPLFFFANDSCGLCHERQMKEFIGSFHTASHTDPLYRRLAEIALEEAGEQVYAYCAGCHATSGVVTGLIPRVAEAELPAEVKAGVTCDTCHQISQLTGPQGPWQEPGNASFQLSPGLVKFGATGEVVKNQLHSGEKRDYFAKAEFCASCHTVIHPTSGLRIEHTYQEWKDSAYAQAGIQCQDCHMATVEDAVTVAQTMKPLERRGNSANAGPERTIHPHYFVGANADAGLLTGGKQHAEMAVARLKSAAQLEIKVPQPARAGGPLQVDVTIRNVAAGHNIPTGVTELRQMWVELHLSDADGNQLFHSGQLQADGKLPDDAIRFGAEALNEAGEVTYKLWEMASFKWKRAVPPKGAVTDTLSAPLPAQVRGPLAIQARLLYRSAPPQVVKAVLQDRAYTPTITEMCSAAMTVPLND